MSESLLRRTLGKESLYLLNVDLSSRRRATVSCNESSD